MCKMFLKQETNSISKAKENISHEDVIMKKKIIKLTPKFLMEALQGKTTSFISNLPDKTELLAVKYDLFSNQVLIIIQNDNFEELSESDQIPEFKVLYSNQTTSKITPTKTLRDEPTLKERGRTPTNISTNGIEKEFSPEQRKLLTFKAEGENILIKTNQYLKEDWSEINGIVKSLGGKWDKNNSYWIIPQNQTSTE